MQIRTRLTLQFLLNGGLIMIIASFAIYFSSVRMRNRDFDKLIWNKARTTVNLLSNTSKVDADRVLEIEKRSPETLQNEIIVVLNSNNNRIVYTTDEYRQLYIGKDIIDRVKSENIITLEQPPFEIVGALFSNDFGRYVVFAAATDIEGSLRQKNIRIILIIVCQISLLIFFIVGWFYSGRALRPISKVVKKVEEISISSLNLRVPVQNENDEIGRLANTFNKMLERLETSFAMQKSFIANASHELRTPLTSINGQLEVLMMKERSTDDYKAALGSVLDDIKSLIDLSNRLLLIARTSAEGPMSYSNKIRIDEILWQTQDEIKKFKKEYNINITMHDSLTDSDQMIVIGDEYMLKVALSNIIENACKYSPDNTVNIILQHSEKCVEIIFQDNGIGIVPDDLKKVFEPFYRGANTRSYSGTGIGLPLVNQIIKNHNGRIILSSQIGKGTRVEIFLPSNS